jgi:lysophospholipase L1-like esterase
MIENYIKMSQQSSRRNFLKSSAIAGLVAGLTPASVLANNEMTIPDIVSVKDKELVFLFQGDSITDGNRGRNNDPNHIMGHGYVFAIVSHIGADFPEAGFSFFNRGISGNKIPDLQKRWQVDTLDLKPDVLSILIGINDTAASVDKPDEAPGIEEFENGYRQLLKSGKATNPDTLFVLGIPFVYPVSKRKEKWELWQEGTQKRAEVVRKLAMEFNAIIVDYPAAFAKVIRRPSQEYWIWDGIHPTVFGHEIMAREWIKQVSARLKFLRKYKRY